MARNLHIFNDQLGFFTNKMATWFESIHPGDRFLNTAPDCKNKIALMHYSRLPEYLGQHLDFVPEGVIFHSYSYFNRRDIGKIKKAFPRSKIRFAWIFWSHEYYQLPEFFSMLYQGFARRFYLRKVVSFHMEVFLKFFKGETNLPFYTGLSSFKKTFKELDIMGALIEDDYNFAMQSVTGVSYQFVSYIALGDFPEIKQDLAPNRQDIMIGHSGSPIINHYEIVQRLSFMQAKNRILIPLSYGKASYIKQLKEKINGTVHNCEIRFLENYMAKDDYYRTIENVGYFFLNSFCQQALGNVLFFLCTGTKIFLRKNTSTYLTLKKRSFHVYSIDDDLNEQALVPLSLAQKEHNRQLAMAMINDEHVKDSWLKILNF